MYVFTANLSSWPDSASCKREVCLISSCHLPGTNIKLLLLVQLWSTLPAQKTSLPEHLPPVPMLAQDQSKRTSPDPSSPPARREKRRAEPVAPRRPFAKNHNTLKCQNKKTIKPSKNIRLRKAPLRARRRMSSPRRFPRTSELFQDTRGLAEHLLYTAAQYRVLFEASDALGYSRRVAKFLAATSSRKYSHR